MDSKGMGARDWGDTMGWWEEGNRRMGNGEGWGKNRLGEGEGDEGLREMAKDGERNPGG